jgi:lipoprotein-releasing system ATP-binding protein
LLTNPFLTINHVSHHYIQGRQRLDILTHIDLQLFPGQTLALLGKSGSGKTTLLNIAGLLERPCFGDIVIDGHSTNTLNDEKRSAMRRKYLGFVYQFHFLINDFSALENLVLAQLIDPSKKKKQCVEKAKILLEKLGLGHRLNHFPKQLSGGEQQRVAIARSLINDPLFVLADEPTGNLDPHTADIVFDQFRQLVYQQKTCALIATHDENLAKKMDGIVQIHEGTLQWIK